MQSSHEGMKVLSPGIAFCAVVFHAHSYYLKPISPFHHILYDELNRFEPLLKAFENVQISKEKSNEIINLVEKSGWESCSDLVAFAKGAEFDCDDFTIATFNLINTLALLPKLHIQILRIDPKHSVQFSRVTLA